MFVVAFVLSLLLGIAVSPAAAQEAPANPATPVQKPINLHTMLQTTGGVFIKDFYELGRVNGLGRVAIEALTLVVAGQETERARGLQIEVVDAEKADLSRFGLLDLEEAEKLGQALEYMSQTARKWKAGGRPDRSEAEFATAGGFRVGFYQRRRDQGAYISAGEPAVARAFFQIEDLERIRAMVLRGLSLLNSK
jgi:hypothetical protein